MLCKDRRTGISLFFRVAPVALIAGEGEVDLPGLQLRLLKAEEVRVQREKNVLEALFLHGAQTVYIPGKKSHTLFLRFASWLSS